MKKNSKDIIYDQLASLYAVQEEKDPAPLDSKTAFSFIDTTKEGREEAHLVNLYDTSDVPYEKPLGATKTQTVLSSVAAPAKLMAEGVDTTAATMALGSSLFAFAPSTGMSSIPYVPWAGIKYAPEELKKGYLTLPEQHENILFEKGPLRGIYDKFPALEEALIAAESDTAFIGNSVPQKFQSVLNILAVHGTRAMLLNAPFIRPIAAAGFLKMGFEEVDTTLKEQVREATRPMYQEYLKQNDLADNDDTYNEFLQSQGIDLSNKALANYVGIGGIAHGAVEYAQNILFLGSIGGMISKTLFKGQMQRVIFRGVAPRVALFAASQLGRAAWEGMQEGSQEGIGIATANAYIFDLNEKRKEEGLPELEGISLEQARARMGRAGLEGLKVGLVLGAGPGSVSALARERRLQNKKALRIEAQKDRARIFVEHEKVATITEKLESQAFEEVNKEYRGELEKAEEGELWAQARFIQQQNMLTGALDTIESQEGSSIREQLINFIIKHADQNSFFMQRYQTTLAEKIHGSTELGKADRLIMEVGMSIEEQKRQNPSADQTDTAKSLLALRTLLDHVAKNLVDPDTGELRFADINEAANELITELNKGQNVNKFLQSQMAKYEASSLEYAFLQMFRNHTLYRDMPVASKYTLFNIDKGTARTKEEAYKVAIFKATKLFQQQIQNRLQSNKQTVTQADIVEIFRILDNMVDIDIEAVMKLEEDGKILKSIRALDGSITFNKDQLNKKEAQFLTQYQELLNNLIYAISSQENLRNEQQRDAIIQAYAYLDKALGPDFRRMLEETTEFMPSIDYTPRGLTSQIIQSLEDQIAETQDPIKKRELTNSLNYYLQHARSQTGPLKMFAQEGPQLVSNEVAQEAAETQRGKPEEQMMTTVLALQKEGSSAVFTDLLEHLGDLAHRAQEQQGIGMSGMGEKVRKLHRLMFPAEGWMTMQEEVDSGIRANAEYAIFNKYPEYQSQQEQAQQEGKPKYLVWNRMREERAGEIQELIDSFWERAQPHLDAYIEAHIKHNKPVTHMGFLGKEAAIALASRDWASLRKISGELTTLYDAYTEAINQDGLEMEEGSTGKAEAIRLDPAQIDKDILGDIIIPEEQAQALANTFGIKYQGRNVFTKDGAVQLDMHEFQTPLTKGGNFNSGKISDETSISFIDAYIEHLEKYKNDSSFTEGERSAIKQELDRLKAPQGVSFAQAGRRRVYTKPTLPNFFDIASKFYGERGDKYATDQAERMTALYIAGDVEGLKKAFPNVPQQVKGLFEGALDYKERLADYEFTRSLGQQGGLGFTLNQGNVSKKQVVDYLTSKFAVSQDKAEQLILKYAEYRNAYVGAQKQRSTFNNTTQNLQEDFKQEIDEILSILSKHNDNVFLSIVQNIDASELNLPDTIFTEKENKYRRISRNNIEKARKQNVDLILSEEAIDNLMARLKSLRDSQTALLAKSRTLSVAEGAQHDKLMGLYNAEGNIIEYLSDYISSVLTDKELSEGITLYQLGGFSLNQGDKIVTFDKIIIKEFLKFRAAPQAVKGKNINDLVWHVDLINNTLAPILQELKKTLPNIEERFNEFLLAKKNPDVDTLSTKELKNLLTFFEQYMGMADLKLFERLFPDKEWKVSPKLRSKEYAGKSVLVKTHQTGKFYDQTIQGFEGTLTGVIHKTHNNILVEVVNSARETLLVPSDDIVYSINGKTLDQLGDQLSSGDKIIKGQTTFMADGTAYLEFFKSADISTVAHEFMHIFSRHMSKAQVGISQIAFINAKFPDMDAASRQDFATKLEKYWALFIKDPSNPRLMKGEADYLLTGYMEYVARQFEKYLMNGVSPTRALTGTFKQVKTAMKEVYDSISDIPDIRSELDPAAKAVFDNLIAGDRYVKTPIPKTVFVEGNAYTVFVSKSSDDKVKILLKKLREGYSDIQGIHSQIQKYATELLGEKYVKKDAELKLKILKVGTFAEAKAAIDYIDRQLLTLQRKSRDEVIKELKSIVAGVEWKKIDAKLAARIKQEIADIDLKRLTPKKLNSIVGMRNWLTNNIKRGIITEDMTNISVDKLQELDRLAQKNIYDFDINELMTLRDALTTIIQQGEKKQFLRIKKRIYYLNNEHDKLMETIKGLKPKDKFSGLDPDPNKPSLEDAQKGLIGGLAHVIRVGGRQPHRLLLYISKFDKQSPLYNFVNMIREGTRIVQQRGNDDRKWMRSLITSINGAKNWSKKRIPEGETIDRRYISTYKVKDSQGRDISLSLTKAERVTIFLYSLNEDSRRHLVEGGIVMPQLKGLGIRYTLTDQTLAEIISDMDLEEKYVAYEILEYYETKVKTAINGVSTNLIGYGIAREFNYFPIYAEGKARGNTEVLNKPALSKSVRQFQKKLIDRQGFLQDRTQSASPLYIHDVFFAMQKNLMDVNRYVGLAEPLNYVKALFRDTQDPNGVYYTIARSWGPDAVQTIDEWINRIEDPTSPDYDTADNIARFVKRTSVTAQLGANMFVSMFQRVSIILANNYDISWSSMGKAIAMNSTPSLGFGITANHSMSEMSELHPQLAPRFETGPNVDVHELYLDSLTRHAWAKPTTAMEDVKRIRNWKTFKTAVDTLSVTSSMRFIKENDAWALSVIWDAVVVEGAKKNWTQDQMRDKFMEIYYNTQPQYDTENISLMMSTKNPLSRIAFSTYQTMPNQIWNEMEYHVRQWGEERKKPKSARENDLNTLRMISKVVNGLVLQNLLVNMIRELRHIGDDDGDEVPYFGGAFLGTLKSMIATVPYAGGLTAGLIDAFADPRNRYNAFDTPGSFASQLIAGAGVEAVESWEAMKDGELAIAAYHGLRVLTKIMGITKGYSWDTIINQIENVIPEG